MRIDGYAVIRMTRHMDLGPVHHGHWKGDVGGNIVDYPRCFAGEWKTRNNDIGTNSHIIFFFFFFFFFFVFFFFFFFFACFDTTSIAVVIVCDDNCTDNKVQIEKSVAPVSKEDEPLDAFVLLLITPITV